MLMSKAVHMLGQIHWSLCVTNTNTNTIFNPCVKVVNYIITDG